MVAEVLHVLAGVMALQPFRTRFGGSAPVNLPCIWQSPLLICTRREQEILASLADPQWRSYSSLQ